jgi:hypothetical protein
VAAVAIVVATTALGACAVDPGGDPAPALGSGEWAFTGGPCPEAGCGANSPVVDNLLEFHELSLVGNALTTGITQPNAADLAIVAPGANHRGQIVQNGVSYDLSVVGGAITGTCRAPCTPLAGPALIGATITLTRGGTPSYVVSIEDVRTMSFFLGGGTTEAYTLTWKSLSTAAGGLLCNNVALLEQQLKQQSGDDNYAKLELMGMQPWETVVFEGDRIDGVAKTMSDGFDDSWFNIGCAAHLLSKLRLTRNTFHGQPPGMVGAWQQRQATMKMLAADYCGGGTPLTVAGQKLVWQGDRMTYFNPPRLLEARWSAQGATCLYAPRMLFPTSSLGSTTFPSIWTAIGAACKAARRPVPPKCADTDPMDFGGALRVSSNP